MAKETAEQKLLKLIESTDSQAAAAQGITSGSSSTLDAQKVIASVKGSGLPSLPPVTENILNMFKAPLTFLLHPGSLGVKDINKLLLVGVILLTVFLVSDFMKGLSASNREVNFEVNGEPLNISGIVLPAFKDLSTYVSVVSLRNIFQPYEAKVAAVEELVPVVENAVIKQKAQGFRIVGISWFDSAETATVMIEDMKSNITYFLKEGETYNDVQVNKIYANQVVLTYQGETLALGL